MLWASSSSRMLSVGSWFKPLSSVTLCNIIPYFVFSRGRSFLIVSAYAFCCNKSRGDPGWPKSSQQVKQVCSRAVVRERFVTAWSWCLWRQDVCPFASEYSIMVFCKQRVVCDHCSDNPKPCVCSCSVPMAMTHWNYAGAPAVVSWAGSTWTTRTGRQNCTNCSAS